MAQTSKQADGEIALFMQLGDGPKSLWESQLETLISDATSFKHPDRDIVHRKSLAVTFKTRIYHAWDWALPVRGSLVAHLKSLAQRGGKAGVGLKGRS